MVAERKEDESPITQQAIFRIGVILISVVVIFLFARQMMIPDSFGQYGRYRGDNINENASRQVSFAGSSKDCAGCHREVYRAVAGASHSGMDCQSCHGPAAKHISKPGAWSLRVEGSAELCGSCHRTIAGRADGKIATVKPLMHSGGVTCTRCHDPHRPWAKLGGSKS